VFFSSRRRHTRSKRDWSSDVCSSDLTGLLGIGFLSAEVYEFAHYITEYGFTFQSSAFGSAFFAIVSFHGGHVIFGIAWLILLMIRNAKRGLNLYNAPKF